MPDVSDDVCLRLRVLASHIIIVPWRVRACALIACAGGLVGTGACGTAGCSVSEAARRLLEALVLVPLAAYSRRLPHPHSLTDASSRRAALLRGGASLEEEVAIKLHTSEVQVVLARRVQPLFQHPAVATSTKLVNET